MAIAITLSGCSVTPFICLSMGHFLCRFSTFCAAEKNEKNLSSRNFIFLQNAPSNSVHLASSFSYAAVANASLRVDVCENDGNII